MTEREDQDLQARFAELRSYDARQAPRFGTRQRKAPRRRLVALPWRWSLLAVAAVTLVAVSLTLGRHNDPPPTASAPTDLVAWRAPSEVLLEYPARALFGPPMPIGASVIDRFIPQTSVFKGDGP
jgi:hypothetical protein